MWAHGLSGSQGRYSRHASLNAVVKRLLSHLRLNGVLRSDGNWPDGNSLVPWKCGQSLVGGITCPDTYAPSHLALAGVEAGCVAAEAEDHRRAKYRELGPCVLFCASGHRDVRSFRPCYCSLSCFSYSFKRVAGSQTSWRIPGSISFCYSLHVQRDNVEAMSKTWS